jgi:hypothetical protein
LPIFELLYEINGAQLILMLQIYNYQNNSTLIHYRMKNQNLILTLTLAGLLFSCSKSNEETDYSPSSNKTQISSVSSANSALSQESCSAINCNIHEGNPVIGDGFRYTSGSGLKMLQTPCNLDDPCDDCEGNCFPDVIIKDDKPGGYLKFEALDGVTQDQLDQWKNELDVAIANNKVDDFFINGNGLNLYPLDAQPLSDIVNKVTTIINNNNTYHIVYYGSADPHDGPVY